MGTGIFISLITDATPLSKEDWGLANRMTAASLNTIAEHGGPRCCKRDSFLAIMDAIHADEMCELTINDLLETQRVSRRQLERVFRQYCNSTPARYLKDLRLDRGRDLLDQTSMSVLDVSIAVGFPSVSNFSNSFAKKFGCTPSRYRL